MAFAFVVREVEKYFAEREVPVPVRMGPREEPRNVDGAEAVIFVPTEVPMIPPTQIGEVPVDLGVRPSGRQPVARALFDAEVTYDVRIIGYDDGIEANDEAHMARCFALLELVAQAVTRAYAGNVAWGRGRWPTAPRELRRGIELRVPLVVTMPIYDRHRLVGAASPVPGDPKPVPTP